MPDDLADELRRLGQRLDAVAPPIAVSELGTQRDEPSVRASGSSSGKRLRLGLIAVVVFLTVATAGALLRSGTDSVNDASTQTGGRARSAATDLAHTVPATPTEPTAGPIGVFPSVDEARRGGAWLDPQSVMERYLASRLTGSTSVPGWERYEIEAVQRITPRRAIGTFSVTGGGGEELGLVDLRGRARENGTLVWHVRAGMTQPIARLDAQLRGSMVFGSVVTADGAEVQVIGLDARSGLPWSGPDPDGGTVPIATSPTPDGAFSFDVRSNPADGAIVRVVSTGGGAALVFAELFVPSESGSASTDYARLSESRATTTAPTPSTAGASTG